MIKSHYLGSKMIRGKKGGETEEWVMSDFLFWIIFGVALAFASITFVILISTSGIEATEIKGDLEIYFLIQRLLSSKNCFASYDESIGVTYGGILDFKKFNNLQLDNCFAGLSDKDPAFKITLSSATLTESPKGIKAKNWAENNPTYKKQSKKIVINHMDKFYNGEILIEIQNFK